MNYLGGKAHVVKQFSPLLTQHAATGVTYWEPFLGGGSVAAQVAASFETCVLSDAMPDLVALWQALVNGWQPPNSLSEGEYMQLKGDAPSPLRTFAGFGVSYGGKWWGGYARPHPKQVNRVGASRNACLKKAASFAHARILCQDYGAINPQAGDLVYCDPPYAGTTSYSGMAAFDHERFWATATEWSRHGVHVYVSEFSAPDGWAVAWQRPHMNHMRRSVQRTDSLWIPIR